MYKHTGTHREELCGAKSSDCTECDPGTYASVDHVTCIGCPVDTYCENGLKIDCEQFRTNTHNPELSSQSSLACVCKGGMHLLETSSTECQSRDESTYCPGTDNADYACPLYMYAASASVELDDCVCNRGYTRQDGDSCSPCVAGKYKNSIGEKACSNCLAGTYSDDVGRTTGNCDERGVGKFSDGPGNSMCEHCGSGKFSAALGARSKSTYDLCLAGTFNAGTAAEQCTDCGLGKHQKSTGAQHCDECTAGTFSDAPGASECEECGEGTSSGATAAQSGSTCTPCIAGTYSASTGRVKCDQ